MKKIVAILLCIAMVFTLCACSAQGFPQSGAGLLEMLKEALQNLSGKICFKFPLPAAETTQLGAAFAP